MGYAFMMAPCRACGRAFSFHPHKVPSIRIEGTRYPICRNCMDEANDARKRNGLPPHPIAEGAYEPCEESEL